MKLLRNLAIFTIRFEAEGSISTVEHSIVLIWLQILFKVSIQIQSNM
jgi:hypothetical protein